MKFHPKVLTNAEKAVLRQLGSLLTPRGFYLGGGTALALRLGHRRSVDLDWFTVARIEDPMKFAQELRDAGVAFEVNLTARGTLHGSVSGVRLSFLEYRYPSLEAPSAWPSYRCVISSLRDLACMKLSAVAQRGSRKDFVDIFALGSILKLPQMLADYEKKYSVADIAHVLYGLSYFDHADAEPMPSMLSRTDWPTVKKTIQRWIREAAAAV